MAINKNRKEDLGLERRLWRVLPWVLVALFLLASDVWPMHVPGADGDRVRRIMPQFDAYVETTFKRSGVPGMAIAVVYRDKAQYLKCLGIKKVGSPDSIEPKGTRIGQAIWASSNQERNKLIL